MRGHLLAISVVLSLLVGVTFFYSHAKPPAPDCATANISVSKARPTDRPIRVLFVGNSFVYVNDLPGVLQAMAERSVPQIRTEQVTVGSATLQWHWENGEALRAIRSRAWDYVVLQEQSAMPLTDQRTMAYYARLFDQEIRRVGAQTLLLMTWADENRQEDEVRIAQAYTDIGAGACGAIVAPVGIAFRTAIAERPTEKLYARDGHHPGVSGTYLAAAVFYRLIEGSTPEKLPDLHSAGFSSALPDLPQEEVDFLLSVAAKVDVVGAYRSFGS